MRPQSGVPLTSNKVVSKNQEKNIYDETVIMKSTMRTDANKRARNNTVKQQQQSATDHASDKMTNPSTHMNQP